MTRPRSYAKDHTSVGAMWLNEIRKDNNLGEVVVVIVYLRTWYVLSETGWRAGRAAGD